MRIYYIEKVKGDQCLITTQTGKYTEVIKISDLEEFSKTATVVGYNKVTKAVEVKTPHDITDYINSKLKLSGKDCKVGDIKGEVEYNSEEDVYTLTLKPEDIGYDMDCIFPIFIGERHHVLKDLPMFKPDVTHYLKIVYDFPMVDVISMDIDDNDYFCHVLSVEIKNKEMLSNCKFAKGIFNIGLIVGDMLYALDLRDLKINPGMKIESFASGFSEILFPDNFFENVEMGNDALSYVRLRRETLLDYMANTKDISSEYEELSISTLIDLHLSDFYSEDSRLIDIINKGDMSDIGSSIETIEDLTLDFLTKDRAELDEEMLENMEITVKHLTIPSDTNIEISEPLLKALKGLAENLVLEKPYNTLVCLDEIYCIKNCERPSYFSKITGIVDKRNRKDVQVYLDTVLENLEELQGILMCLSPFEFYENIMYIKSDAKMDEIKLWLLLLTMAECDTQQRVGSGVKIIYQLEGKIK